MLMKSEILGKIAEAEERRSGLKVGSSIWDRITDRLHDLEESLRYAPDSDDEESPF